MLLSIPAEQEETLQPLDAMLQPHLSLELRHQSCSTKLVQLGLLPYLKTTPKSHLNHTHTSFAVLSSLLCTGDLQFSFASSLILFSRMISCGVVIMIVEIVKFWLLVCTSHFSSAVVLPGTR